MACQNVCKQGRDDIKEKLNIQSLISALFLLLIIYLFSVNTFTPMEKCAIICVIAEVEKLLIGQKIQKLH